ncbi:sugar-binding protein, partial [Chryseobacterium indologenes]
TQTSVQLLQYFGPSQLYKNTVTDEDGNKTIEFKNGKGQVILVRKVLNASENADTYYVYNEYDQLAFVIPPLITTWTTLDETALNNLSYQYRYDGKGRLVEKKLPGKGWEYMVYDKADKLILTQDANQRTSFSWMIYKYDAWGRPIYTGILTANNTRAGMQSQVSDTSVIESRNNTALTANDMTYYYSNMYWGLNTLLSVTYYDSYPRLYDFNPSYPST